MIADYAWADNCLSFKECRLIRKYCRDKIKTSLVEGGVECKDRKSKNCFIPKDGCPPEIRESIKKALRYYFQICKEVLKLMKNHASSTVLPYQELVKKSLFEDASGFSIKRR